MKNFDELLELVESHPLRKVAVAAAGDPTVLGAVDQARRRDIATSVLVGDEGRIAQSAEAAGVDLSGIEIVHRADPIAAIAEATRLVSSGQADILMKGYVHTDDFLRGVLDKEYGLRTGSIMSHGYVVELKAWDRLIFITDAALNIAPDLEA